MEEDDESFSPRNKLEALHTVESLIRQLKHERSGETRESLENLHATVVRRLENFGPAEVVNELVSTCSGGSEAALSEWAARHGVKSKLQIAGQQEPAWQWKLCAAHSWFLFASS